MTTPTPVTDPQVLEARALRLSAGAALAFAALGVVWGIAASSQAILFDGVFALLGFALSWLGMRAASVIEAGPTARYPFGREALAPLVVGIQALVLAGTFAYASVDAIMVIRDGGSDTAVGSALVYSMITLFGSIALMALLRRRQAGSDLVAAEVAQWKASVVFGVALTVGFAAASILTRTSAAAAAPFVDPILVIVAGLLIMPTPARMLRQAYRELLEGLPGQEVTEPIHAAVARLVADEDLTEPEMRIGKLGRKVYVELDWVLPTDSPFTISDADRFRRRLMDDLRTPGQYLWLNVELHTSPNWDTA